MMKVCWLLWWHLLLGHYHIGTQIVGYPLSNGSTWKTAYSYEKKSYFGKQSKCQFNTLHPYYITDKYKGLKYFFITWQWKFRYLMWFFNALNQHIYKSPVYIHIDYTRPVLAHQTGQHSRNQIFCIFQLESNRTISCNMWFVASPSKKTISHRYPKPVDWEGGHC